MTFYKSYKIIIEKKAQKFLDGLDRAEHKKLVEKIKSLTASDPKPLDIKKLKGYKNLHRLGVDDYRVIFVVIPKKKMLIVVIIGHRREVYDIVKRLSF